MGKFWKELNEAACAVMLMFAIIGILDLEHTIIAGVNQLFLWLVFW